MDKTVDSDMEVRPLLLCHQAKIRREWLKMWASLGERVLKLPKWMQEIVLEDIKNAVDERVTIMEIILRGFRS